MGVPLVVELRGVVGDSAPTRRMLERMIWQAFAAPW